MTIQTVLHSLKTVTKLEFTSVNYVAQGQIFEDLKVHLQELSDGLDNTAVSVDQHGQHKGAIAIYQDIWHKDILNFIDFGDRHLFGPHKIKKVMGFSLEDFYDKKKLKPKESKQN